MCNKAPGAAVGLPLRQTTALAAPRLRAFKPPTGGKVVVWCEACSLCPTVVQACRAPPWLGRGPDQHRPDWAAVTHRQLVCLA